MEEQKVRRQLLLEEQKWLETENVTPKRANHRIRIQLAAVHRAIAEHGWSDGVFGHLSALAPAQDGSGEIILITPFPIEFSQVFPSSLVGITKDGKVVEGGEGMVIFPADFHRGMYSVQKDIRCIFHVDTTYATIVGTLEKPELYMGVQSNLSLYGDVAVDNDFGGLTLDHHDGQRVGKMLGNSRAMLQCHRGAMTVGKSIAEAFFSLYTLELSCKFQVKLLSTGLKTKKIPEEMCLKVHDQLHAHKMVPQKMLKAIIYRLAQTYTDFISL